MTSREAGRGWRAVRTAVWLAAAAAVLSGGCGDETDGPGTTPPVTAVGEVSGIVLDDRGARVAGALVEIDGKTATTDATGGFGIGRVASNRDNVVRITAPMHSAMLTTTRVAPDGRSRLAVSAARAERASFSATTEGRASALSGRASARVMANSLRRKTGEPYAAMANLDLTVLETPERMRSAPMGMRAREGGVLEAFSVLNLRATASDESELVSMMPIELELPPAEGSGLTEGSTVDVYELSESLAAWQKIETVVVTAGKAKVRGSLGWFALARPMRTGCARGQVSEFKEQLGVTAVGTSYLGATSGTSASDGSFCVEGRVSSDLAIDIGERFSYRISLTERTGSCGTPATCQNVGVLQTSVTAACDVSACAPPERGEACCTSVTGSCAASVGFGCGREAPFVLTKLPDEQPNPQQPDAGMSQTGRDAMVPDGVPDAGTGRDASVPPRGARGSACIAFGSSATACDEGLECVPIGGLEQSICPEGGSGCCLPARKQGQHCAVDASYQPLCDPGLGCLSGEAARTACGTSYCCMPAGGLNQPCGANNTCSAELTCTYPSTDAERTACGGSPSCCLPTGGMNERCGSSGSTCDPGLTCTSAYGGSSSTTVCGGLSSCCLPSGGSGQPCRSDNTCDAGFACTYAYSSSSGANLCGGLSSCCLPSGGSGQPCRGDNTCDAGLTCTSSYGSGGSTGLCGGLSSCCLPSGASGQPCRSDGTCDPGFRCESPYDSTKTLCRGIQQCCLPTGGEGQACRSEGYPCDGEMQCASVSPYSSTSADTACGGLYSCCLPVGKLEQACDQTRVTYPTGCEDGLVCVSGGSYSICPKGLQSCCKDPGGQGQPCGSNLECDAGLTCIRDFSSASDVKSRPCGGAESCCAPGGSAYQPCPIDKTFSYPGYLKCEQAGHVCGESFQRECGDQRYCCMPGGGMGEPCGQYSYASSGCNQGLSCQQATSNTICKGRTQCCLPQK